jgi:hypothetical protein
VAANAYRLSCSPPSYVQVLYSSILLTNVLHCNTESFILHILFLKGSSSKQLTVAKVEYSMHLSVDRVTKSIKINKSKQTIYLEVNCQN